MSAVERLEAMLKKAAPRPWDANTIASEGEYGDGPNPGSGFDVATIVDDAGKTLFDALNSDACYVMEETASNDGDVYAWDTVSLANAVLIVAAVNSLPALLSCARALEKIRDHNGVSYRFGDEVREIASSALAMLEESK